MNNQNEVTESEIKMVMTGLLQDLTKLGGAKPCKKWIEWKDKRTGLIVRECQ
ncbi:MAG: hypothetical protein WCF23_16720 [Candidatus Nitrosopolaris sp.]